MAGVQDVGAGAGSAGAARGNIGGHRHRRGQDCLDDLAHRGVEAAGRVHLDDHELMALLGGAGEAVHDIVGICRADHAIDGQHADAWGSTGCAARCRGEGQGQQQGQHQQAQHQQARQPHPPNHCCLPTSDQKL
jgi:hypothetical protein